MTPCEQRDNVEQWVSRLGPLAPGATQQTSSGATESNHESNQARHSMRCTCKRKVQPRSLRELCRNRAANELVPEDHESNTVAPTKTISQRKREQQLFAATRTAYSSPGASTRGRHPTVTSKGLQSWCPAASLLLQPNCRPQVPASRAAGHHNYLPHIHLRYSLKDTHTVSQRPAQLLEVKRTGLMLPTAAVSISSAVHQLCSVRLETPPKASGIKPACRCCYPCCCPCRCCCGTCPCASRWCCCCCCWPQPDRRHPLASSLS